MNKQEIVNCTKTLMTMEWYGIRAEKSTEVEYITHYYISVPESSTIEIEDQELNAQIKTSDGLVTLGKDMVVKSLLESCRAVSDDDEDFIEEVKNNISEYIKVYARVRKGEVWTKEMGDARVEELINELKEELAYQEV